jgi:hypothetical protein
MQTDRPTAVAVRLPRKRRNAMDIARRHPRMFAALDHTLKVRRG